MWILERLFLDHPRSVRESYFEHLLSAWSFAARMLTGAMACAVHGLAPFLFQHTASNAVRELHERMVTHRTPRSLTRGTGANVR